MTSKLDQLKAFTTVVADTGDMDAIRTFKPTDCTTNPTLVLKAAALPAYEGVIADAISWGKKQAGNREAVIGAVADRLAVAFGSELARLVPGRVSTEVDAEAGAFLISPFVGRILDWYVKNEGKSYTAETDPGVLSVRQIYAYYKRHGYNTVVMGASFRNLGEIEALAGCDRLTIAPALLDQLAKDEGALPRQLDPAIAGKAGVDRLKVDEASFRFLLNEDAKATEKLAEGIRAFAKDLGALKDMVAAKLAG